MIEKLLIANRGEIAVRIIRTARRMGIRTVAVHSDADAGAPHVSLADEALRIGPAPAAESYLSIPAILEAAVRSGADAVHPGYGFLSENPDFVDAVEEAGLVFVGPPAEAIRAMGLKDAAKRLMEAAGVPVVPGWHGEEQDPARLASEAAALGFPVLIKARAGGGGRGMRRVDRPEDFPAALAAARREAEAAFGDPACLVETYVTRPRHIEIQVFADRHGTVLHLGERDCSLQRRHQKVIEESPAPGLSAEMRATMGEAAVRAAAAIGYVGAGTVEFIADASDGLRPDRFWFMEMNTRLQVEHPVTEAVTGLDLVEWQLRVAMGEPLPFAQEDIRLAGHAVEARLYAEDPAKGFLPATGRLERLDLPRDLARVDAGVAEGDAVTPWYDPMIAKVIVHAPTREEAFARLAAALDHCRVAGTVTNAAFLAALARHPEVRAGDVDTGLIDRALEDLVVEAEARPETLAAAALVALGFAHEPAGPDPFDTLAGWRAWGEARRTVSLVRGERRVDLSVVGGPPRFRLETAGRTFPVTLLAGSAAGLALELGGHRVAVPFAYARDAITVFEGAHAFTFRRSASVDDGEADEAGDDRLRAPMTGMVRQVAAGAGDPVVRGAVVVVVEAMKMEHAVLSPRDGIVAAVTVAEGDRVEEGAVLVELEARH